MNSTPVAASGGPLLACDKAPADKLAFDRGTVRTIDQDGRMHVEMTNISKACVNGYLGAEIPNWQLLGLEPGRMYQLLRDPEELAKGAATANGIQLMAVHEAVSAHEPKREYVAGALGSDAVFEAPYLRNSLTIWTAEDIENVESKKVCELSASYHYDPDMTPGIYEGARFDGVMRNIRFNHIALVERGRAGPDVLVADSALPITVTSSQPLEPLRMKLSPKAIALKGALKTHFTPLLAQDAKLGNLNPLLGGIDAKTLEAQKPALIAALTKHFEGKLAKDADLGALPAILDVLMEADPDEETEVAADPIDEIIAMLQGKLSEDELASCTEKIRGLAAPKAADEFPPKDKDDPAEKPAAKDAEADPKKDDKEKPAMDSVSKPAMDAAIANAVKAVTETARRNQVEIRDAERAVRPYVGELAMAHDSAEAVYRTALKSLGQNVDAVKDAAALPIILAALPTPGAKPTPRVALDSAGMKSYTDMFPDAGRIGHA